MEIPTKLEYDINQPTTADTGEMHEESCTNWQDSQGGNHSDSEDSIN